MLSGCAQDRQPRIDHRSLRLSVSPACVYHLPARSPPLAFASQLRVARSTVLWLFAPPCPGCPSYRGVTGAVRIGPGPADPLRARRLHGTPSRGRACPYYACPTRPGPRMLFACLTRPRPGLSLLGLPDPARPTHADCMSHLTAAGPACPRLARPGTGSARCSHQCSRSLKCICILAFMDRCLSP